MATAESYDPNDKKQVEKRKRREKLADVRAADDVRAVMGTPEGRRLVNGLIGLSGVRDSSYRPGHLDQQRHQDYLLGRQSVGLQLLEQIETHAPNETELMTAEARKDAAELRATLEAENIDAAAEDQTEQTNG